MEFSLKVITFRNDYVTLAQLNADWMFSVMDYTTQVSFSLLIDFHTFAEINEQLPQWKEKILKNKNSCA